MPDVLERRPWVARRAAVAAPNHLAAAAGLRTLARGGNAVDAMVATNAALGVVYPHMTGPGGDAFWMVFDARTRQAHVLNASGRAARAATRERFLAGGATEINPRGHAAALTVPGAVDGWFQAHRRFGRLPFSECLAPAIEYAREGVPVAPGLAAYMAMFHSVVSATPATAAVFLKPGGQAYTAGEVLRNPRLANTLSAIAEGGRSAFYEGPIAAAVGEYLAHNGGLLTADDFAQHTSDWTAPVQVSYRGYRALNVPPNAQGFAALQILGMLDRFDVASLRDDTVGYLDLMVRATGLAFEDRDRYLTDPAFAPVPLDRLLSSEYIDERAALLAKSVGSDVRTIAAGRASAHASHEDTTFSCCVDAEGNAVGVIQSLYFEWGSGVVAGETGLLLQNRGAFFSLDETHPNRLEPGKRTFHTLIVGMLVDPSDRPALVYGCMGGEGQPQSQAALATRVVDFGMNVQAAIDAPRWLYGRTWGEQFRGLRLEGRFGAEVVDGLLARGHERVSLVEDWSDLMGHAQAIEVWPDRLEAGADPRADGAALGF